jgi:hypothetical protein
LFVEGLQGIGERDVHGGHGITLVHRGGNKNRPAYPSFFIFNGYMTKSGTRLLEAEEEN